MTLDELELRVRVAVPGAALTRAPNGILARMDRHEAIFYVVEGNLRVDREWSIFPNWTVGVEDKVLSVTAHQVIAVRRRLTEVPA